MPRPASDRAAIEAEIAHVRSLGLDELHTLWRLTFRSAPPPAFTKDLMARFLCWDIQEQAFGGLDPETAKHLDGLAQGNKPGMDRPRRLKPGTVLLREYQGERHTVTVVANGYVWHETTYASLSDKFNRLLNIPPALDPIRSRNAHEQRCSFWPRISDAGNNLAQDSSAILK